MSVLSFIIGMGMLGWSGWALAGKILPADRWMRIAFALPLGALLQTLLLLKCTLLHVPITWYGQLLAHAVIGILLLWLPWSLRPAPLVVSPSRTSSSRLDMILRWLCGLLLIVQFLFAGAHAVMLPTYHIDSLTNWTMRAKVSWIDQELAFDLTEERGVAKPQYPFLVHGVQIAANVVAPMWSDRAANTATFLLTITSLSTLFLLLRKLRGLTIALAATAAVTSIPLLSFHMAQGYGDVHLVTYLLLALGFVIAARTTDVRFYLPSALMIAAAVWTKTEGLVIGLLPWLLLVGVDLPFSEGRRERITAMLVGGGLSLLFPLFLFLWDLPFTPHSSDAFMEFHPEAVLPALAGLVSPSMGLAFPAALVGLLSVLWLWKKNDARLDCRLIITLFWGVLALLIVLATYTLTPNARFLLNGESYYRQLMIPASLLMIALAATFRARVS